MLLQTIRLGLGRPRRLVSNTTLQYSFEIITVQFAFSQDFLRSNLQKLSNNAMHLQWNSFQNHASNEKTWNNMP